MPRMFSTGIEVPSAGDKHPSEAWWSRVGSTTNAALLRMDAAQSAAWAAAVEALRADTVSRDDAEQYGIPGPATTLSVGTVQGGETAGASITGEAPEQSLHLTLPQGPRGPEGPGGAFELQETEDVGMFEVSDVPNAALQAAAEAAVQRLTVNVEPQDITANLPGVSSGTLTISRFGPMVTLNWNNVVVAPTGETAYSSFSRVVPLGFRPEEGYSYFTTPTRPFTTSSGTGRVDLFGHVVIYSHKADDVIRGTWTWRTADAAPTT